MSAACFDFYRLYGREVRDANVSPSGVLEVPHGFLGESHTLLPLWVHPNYLLLEDFLVRSTSGGNESTDVDGAPRRVRRRRGSRQFHLVATPGIGKSYFGHYWFFKQAKDRKKVIWRTKAGLFLYYDFSLPEPLVHASSSYAAPEHWNNRASLTATWLIVDGRCRGVDHFGLVLQCVSPGRSGYHEFAKDVGMLCCLEAWTLDELLECRDCLGLDFTDAEMRQRFFYCGGVPRYVLDERKSIEDLKRLMAKALSWAPSWEAVIKHAASAADKDRDISASLLHYQLVRRLDQSERPSDCVRHYTLKFGSDFVENTVVDQYQKEGHEKVRQFFYFCQAIPEAHGLAGKMFERHVHKTMQDGGGNYKVKDLVTPGNPVSHKTLRPTSSKRLHRWEIAKIAAGAGPPRKPSTAEKVRGLFEVQFSVYGQNTPRAAAGLGDEESTGLASLPSGCFISPYSATFKSLDSFLVPDIMFQCTYSLEHKLFWAPIMEIVQEYDRWHLSRSRTPPEYYSLIFIVPEWQFRDFKFQGYKKEDGSDYERTQSGMSRVRQFALSFPW